MFVDRCRTVAAEFLVLRVILQRHIRLEKPIDQFFLLVLTVYAARRSCQQQAGCKRGSHDERLWERGLVCKAKFAEQSSASAIVPLAPLESFPRKHAPLLWPGREPKAPLLARLFIVYRFELRNNQRMAEHVYKKIEIVGSSPNGMEEAVLNALSRASKTIRNMRWFEVTETRGYIDEGKIEHWQVTLKIGFTLDG